MKREAVFGAAFKELVDLWGNICLSETDFSWVVPSVTHVEPYTEERLKEAERVKRFYMNDLSRDEVERTLDLREFAREAYDLSQNSFNETWLFQRQWKTDSFLTKLFGPTKRPLYPEVDTSLEAVRKDAGTPVIYDTFLQRQEKYKNKVQPELQYDKDCPIPRCHTDKRWDTCCNHLFTDTSKMRRHSRKLHPHPSEFSCPHPSES